MSKFSDQEIFGKIKTCFSYFIKQNLFPHCLNFSSKLNYRFISQNLIEMCIVLPRSKYRPRRPRTPRSDIN